MLNQLIKSAQIKDDHSYERCLLLGISVYQEDMDYVFQREEEMRRGNNKSSYMKGEIQTPNRDKTRKRTKKDTITVEEKKSKNEKSQGLYLDHGEFLECKALQKIEDSKFLNLWKKKSKVEIFKNKTFTDDDKSHDYKAMIGVKGKILQNYKVGPLNYKCDDQYIRLCVNDIRKDISDSKYDQVLTNFESVLINNLYTENKGNRFGFVAVCGTKVYLTLFDSEAEIYSVVRFNNNNTKVTGGPWGERRFMFRCDDSDSFLVVNLKLEEDRNSNKETAQKNKECSSSKLPKCWFTVTQKGEPNEIVPLVVYRLNKKPMRESDEGTGTTTTMNFDALIKRTLNKTKDNSNPSKIDFVNNRLKELRKKLIEKIKKYSEHVIKEELPELLQNDPNIENDIQNIYKEYYKMLNCWLKKDFDALKYGKTTKTYSYTPKTELETKFNLDDVVGQFLWKEQD